jgi:RNA polymerase sigma-70 factor (ECF subfamily)
VPVDDDAALVRRCLRGDDAAIRALVERFQDTVFGLCLKFLRHRQDAEDVAQEVFVRIIRGLKGWDSTRPLRPWILAIAANRCRTHASRRSGRAEPIDFLAETLPAPESDDTAELRRELATALAGLRPEYRAAFVLYHEQGRAYEAIAEQLGRPVGTVKTWLHRARLELLDALRSRGLVEIDHDV